MEVREQDIRTAALIGEEALARLRSARVAVLGIGGVGSFVAEALARAGVGAIDLFDSDTVSVSNINRQAIALHSTVGRLKTEVAKDRILDINPECQVECHSRFITPDDIPAVGLEKYDYIVDAIDTTAVKVELAVYCEEHSIRLISCMGTGNKLDPTRFRIADIYKTSVCPLARAIRTRLKQRGVKRLSVVFSDEVPRATDTDSKKTDGKGAPASISFVPSAAGLIIASEVIKTLIFEYI